MWHNRRIVRREPARVSPDFSAGLHPVLARVYAARKLTRPEQLDHSLDRLHDAHSLKGIDTAASLLAEAIRTRQRILIIADFDADGATSCALAVRALRMLGTRDVRYVVPNRFEFGYGLTPEIVAVAAREHPDVIVTVDNGISSLAGVHAAMQAGMRVIITDHHLPGTVIPAADAIVNPNQPGCPFPSKHLAGVGVIFYVMLALRTVLRESGWFSATGRKEPKLADLLDLVALGTVADVVPLDQNNRILVEQGLRRIRAGCCSAGIRALADIAGRRRERLVCDDLGFAIGPRLNAAGRLEDMSLGIECLLVDDLGQALRLAARLNDLNLERRRIEGDMQEQALSIVETLHLEGKASLPFGLCLYDQRWHQGVVGLLAGRIRERLQRPVIAFARAADGELRGSARSIPGLHIRDVLDALATTHPDLLVKFGGHAMAAGLTIRAAHYDPFRQAFDAEVRRRIDAADLEGVLLSDGELNADELDLDVAEQLRFGGPWGQGFPAPVFDGRFQVLGRQELAGRHLKLVLRPAGGGGGVDAIAFNTKAEVLPPETREVEVAYRLEVNEYRGLLSPQLVIEQLVMADTATDDSGISAGTVRGDG